MQPFLIWMILNVVHSNASMNKLLMENVSSTIVVVLTSHTMLDEFHAWKGQNWECSLFSLLNIKVIFQVYSFYVIKKHFCICFE